MKAMDELARPAREALRSGLDSSYWRRLESVDHKSFEVKIDPVTAVVNLRSDVRELHMIVARLEAELRHLECRVDVAAKAAPVRLGWRMKIKRWWRGGGAA